MDEEDTFVDKIEIHHDETLASEITDVTNEKSSTNSVSSKDQINSVSSKDQIKSSGIRIDSKRIENKSPVQLNSPECSDDGKYEHDEEKKALFCCSYCDKNYQKRSSLLRHIGICHTESIKKVFDCNQCDKKYYNISELKRHQETHIGIKKFCCEVCGSQFSHRSHFTQHVRIHTGERPYCCGDCGKRFRSKSYLQEHMSVHIGKGQEFQNDIQVGRKKATCQICNKVFCRKSILARHMKDVHEKVREYECHLCDFVTSRQFSLANHIKYVHAQSLPCPLCEKTVNSRMELKRHIKVHKRVKEFTCKLCSKICNSKDELLQHMYDLHVTNDTSSCKKKTVQTRKYKESSKLGQTNEAMDDMTNQNNLVKDCKIDDRNEEFCFQMDEDGSDVSHGLKRETTKDEYQQESQNNYNDKDLLTENVNSLMYANGIKVEDAKLESNEKFVPGEDSFADDKETTSYDIDHGTKRWVVKSETMNMDEDGSDVSHGLKRETTNDEYQQESQNNYNDNDLLTENVNSLVYANGIKDEDTKLESNEKFATGEDSFADDKESTSYDIDHGTKRWVVKSETIYMDEDGSDVSHGLKRETTNDEYQQESQNNYNDNDLLTENVNSLVYANGIKDEDTKLESNEKFATGEDSFADDKESTSYDIDHGTKRRVVKSETMNMDEDGSDVSHGLKRETTNDEYQQESQNNYNDKDLLTENVNSLMYANGIKDEDAKLESNEKFATGEDSFADDKESTSYDKDHGAKRWVVKSETMNRTDVHTLVKVEDDEAVTNGNNFQDNPWILMDEPFSLKEEDKGAKEFFWDHTYI